MKCVSFLLAAFLLFLDGSVFGAEKPTLENSGWKTVWVKGQVVWMPAEKGSPQDLREGNLLKPGDELRVGKDSQTVIRSEDGKLARLAEGAWVRLMDSKGPEGERRILKLLGGRLLVQSGRDSTLPTLKVEAGALSTSIGQLLAEWTLVGQDMEMAVSQGECRVAFGEWAVAVPSGSFASFRGGLLRVRRRLDRSEKERFDNWRPLREGLRLNATSPSTHKTSPKKKR